MNSEYPIKVIKVLRVNCRISLILTLESSVLCMKYKIYKTSFHVLHIDSIDGLVLTSQWIYKQLLNIIVRYYKVTKSAFA